MKDTGGYYLPRQTNEAISSAVVTSVTSPKRQVARNSKQNTVSRFYVRYLKRTFDIVFALAALPFVLPALAVLYFVVRKDGGPFLFSHNRIGKDGEVFGCLKIRTMVVGADKVLRDLIESDVRVRDEWKRHFKLRDDPRITPIGRLLRKTSLDELPQIFNILSGKMSVVGPRPITSEELALYGDAETSYKAVRPGLTGPWQITGRRENEFDNRARLDVEYVRNISLKNDLFILFATVPEVLFARGR